jgi:hypothetical protein
MFPVRLALAIALLAATASALAAQSAPRGAVAGVVRDEAGRPVAGARVSIEALARQVRVDSSGAFALADLPAGPVEVTIRALGFRPAVATLEIPANQTVNIAITLAPVAVALDAVVIQAQVFNQLAGMVIDEDNRPVDGVIVDVLGLNRRTQTANGGAFLMTDLAPGSYILQLRKDGYRVTQYAVRMIEQIDRNISMRLRPLDPADRFTPEIAALVAREMDSRLAWRNNDAVLVTREELERFDSAPLGVALGGSTAAVILRRVATQCILLNGYEPVSERGRGSSDASGAGGWLNHFRANEIEMVEVYLSDLSGTLANRFPSSSGCSSSGLVIWLRR